MTNRIKFIKHKLLNKHFVCIFTKTILGVPSGLNILTYKYFMKF